MKEKVFRLKKMADIPIGRYVKIRKEANLSDHQWFDCFEKKRRKAS